MKKKVKLLKEIMTKRVVMVPSHALDQGNFEDYGQEEVSAVAVESPERGVMGIVSECDILCHFGKLNWELLTAEEIMTPHVEAIRPETTLEEAANVMNEKHIHRLLVMGRDLSEPQMPAGIVSASDIVKEIGKGSF